MDEKLKEALENFLNALRDCDAVKHYTAVKEAYIADGELVTLINEYNMQGQMLRDEGAKPERDDVLIGEITDKLKETYDAIMMNARMQEMQQAEQVISEIISDIDRGIRSVVMSEDVEGGACSGNCSSCGGCH